MPRRGIALLNLQRGGKLHAARSPALRATKLPLKRARAGMAIALLQVMGIPEMGDSSKGDQSMSRFDSKHHTSGQSAPGAAGGMSSPPVDPPPASPTPLQGQKETNRIPKSEADCDFVKESVFAKDPNYA